MNKFLILFLFPCLLIAQMSRLKHLEALSSRDTQDVFYGDQYVRGYWALPDLTHDSSRFENHLTLQSDGLYVSEDNAAGGTLNPDTRDFTIEAWFKAVEADSQEFIWSNHGSANGANYFLYIMPDTGISPPSPGQLNGKITDDEPQNISYNATGYDVANNIWHHVAVQYNYNLGDGYVTTWIDGNKWKVEDGASNQIDSINVTEPFVLKNIDATATGTYGRFTEDGDSIGEIRFSMVYRTAQEIADYYEGRADNYGITPDPNITRPHIFVEDFENVDSLYDRWITPQLYYKITTDQYKIGNQSFVYPTDSGAVATTSYINMIESFSENYISFFVKLAPDFSMGAGDDFYFITTLGLNGVGFYFGIDENSGNFRPQLRRIYGGSSFSYGSNLTADTWYWIKIYYPSSGNIQWWVNDVSQGTIAAVDNALYRFDIDFFGLGGEATTGNLYIDHIQWTEQDHNEPTSDRSAPALLDSFIVSSPDKDSIRVQMGGFASDLDTLRVEYRSDHYPNPVGNGTLFFEIPASDTAAYKDTTIYREYTEIQTLYFRAFLGDTIPNWSFIDDTVYVH